MEKDIAIKVDGLSKTFKLPHNKQSSIKGIIINAIRRGVKTYETQQVLKDVSFEVKKGEFFGIVGRNGSGKSTLLKLLAGIYSPTEGRVEINGSLTPFIELGVGFNPELTGRENVYLNGALLGFNNKIMSEMYGDIVEFAELGRFMDQKLKNYSSGMQVRLAFSIAIRARSDILLLDEVLAVGDEAFQRKCYDYFRQLKKEKKTVILVTHDMNAVRRFCTRAVYIDEGQIALDGGAEDIANHYTVSNFSVEDEDGLGDDSDRVVKDFVIKTTSSQVLSSKDTFSCTISYTVTEDLPLWLGVSLIDENSGGATSVFDDHITDSQGKHNHSSTKKGSYIYNYEIPLSRFNNRNLIFKASLFRGLGDDPELIAYTKDANSARFLVRGEKTNGPDGGLLKEKGRWVK